MLKSSLTRRRLFQFYLPEELILDLMFAAYRKPLMKGHTEKSPAETRLLNLITQHHWHNQHQDVFIFLQIRRGHNTGFVRCA